MINVEKVKAFFKKRLGINPIILSKQQEFLKVLKGVTDPEKKRKIIGRVFEGRDAFSLSSQLLGG